LHYIRQIADALQYIHERKMNHLDVKPGNVLLDDDGNAVLIDFGLAKRYDAEGNQTSTTPVGISHGYAPLEQYKKGGVSMFSPTTDIYSLGATFYKLITGKTPPEADDVNEDGLPVFPSDVSPLVVVAIERAMQPVRKNRPQSISEFLALLDTSISAVERNAEKVVPVSNADESTVFPEDEKKDNNADNKVNAPKVADSKPVIVEPKKKKRKLWLWILIVLLGIGVGIYALFISVQENFPPTEAIVVDLGLPSGTLWADRNVGASSPEDYGGYFAWGETTPMSEYSCGIYKWGNWYYQSELTKYCTNSSFGYKGFTDGKTTLESADDVAAANMVGSWRMPTEEEFRELEDKCIWTWTVQNGVKGYKVTGPNGNSIFLPSAGYRTSGKIIGSTCLNAGSVGSYWSSSLYERNQDRACYLHFSSESIYMSNLGRSYGYTVRAVAR
jgi:hypothetical protein